MTLRRDRGIEGVRGLAALAVVVAHLPMILMGAEGASATSVGQRLVGEGVLLLSHGVTVFFVLSGYLLYRPFAADLMGMGRAPDVRSFYRNRALRILPAYWVILAVCGWVLGSVAVESSADLDEGARIVERTGYLTDPLQILANVTLTQGYSPATVGAISPAWSLVPEVAFYALLPVLWLAARRLFRTPSFRAALAPGLLLVAVGLVGFEASVHLVTTVGEGRFFADTWPSRLYRSLLATCQLFGFGMLVAALVARTGAADLSGTTAPAPRPDRLRRTALLVLAFSALAYLPLRMLGQDRIIVGVAAAALLVLTVLPGCALTRAWTRLLESRPLHRAGVISYSVYLWHYPLTLFLVREWPGLGFTTFGGFLVAAAVVVPLTLLLSEVTYRFVERPALARKKAVVPTGEPAASVAARA